MNAARSDAIVFYGATGDLAYKQIFPALSGLVRHSGFDLPVIGVARSNWGVDQLRERMHESLAAHGGVDEAAFAKLSARLAYVAGDYAHPATYRRLKQVLGSATRPLHYLAIPPSMFGTVVEGLAA